MSESDGDTRKERFEVRTTSDSHFSWIRTRLGLERTLMSWVRTAVALIGFGFTIVQFFERLHTMEGVDAARHPQAPRYLGLALIAAGVVALIVSAWQYRWVVRYMWQDDFRPIAGMAEKTMQTPLFIVAVALILIGVFAFISVLLRLG